MSRQVLKIALRASIGKLALLLLVVAFFSASVFGQPMSSSVSLKVNRTGVAPYEIDHLQAIVTAGGEPVFGGTVSFFSGSKCLGTVQVVGHSPATGFSSGTASLAIHLLPGTLSLVATYDGMSGVSAGHSLAVGIDIVGPSASSLLLTPISNESIAFTANGYGIDPFGGDVLLNSLSSSQGLASVSIKPANSGEQFLSGSRVRVSHNPSSMVAADFNLDGATDIAVANDADGTIAVFLGNVTHDGYTVSQTLSLGIHATSMVSADFNGDGLPDLAMTDVNGSDVMILLNNPDHTGTFIPAGITIPVGAGPMSIVVADFNLDGFPDLAVANFMDNSVSILLGNPEDPGRYKVFQTIQVNSGPSAVLIGDFDGDGSIDLAVAAYYSNCVWLLRGNPSSPGQFISPNYVSPAGSGPIALASADFNGDGMLDLAVSNSLDDTISILWGSRDNPGLMPTQEVIDVGKGPYSIASADVDGDGLPDLISTESQDGTLGILTNLGGGRFSAEEVISSTAGIGQLVKADFGGNRSIDIATLGGDSGLAFVFKRGHSIQGTIGISPLSPSGGNRVQAKFTPTDEAVYAVSISNAVSLFSVPGMAVQSINFPVSDPGTYGGGAVILAATATSGLPIAYRVVSGSAVLTGSSLMAGAAGTVVMEAGQAGDASHSAATPVQQTVVFDKARLSVASDAASRSFADPNPVFSGQLIGLVAGDSISATFVSSATTSTPVGVYSDLPYAILGQLNDPQQRLSNYTVLQLMGTLSIVASSPTHQIPRPNPPPPSFPPSTPILPVPVQPPH